jgi:hemerythrin superfamily protein
MAKDGAVQPIESTHGVVQYLTEQHRHIRSLFDQVGRESGQQRADSFVALRRLLAVHETAEELVVHPRARWRLPDGDPVSSPRLQEEEQAKQMMVALEKLPVDGEAFQAGLTRLREAVLAHAEAEEREEFSRLEEVLGVRELARMRTAARLAEAIAPTRAHPNAIFAAENVVVGGFTALLDRFRDLISHPDAGDGAGGQDR